MRYSKIKEKQLKNKKYINALIKQNEDVIYRVGRMLVEARILKGITQEDLASKLNTHQSAIARIESGKYNVSLGLLNKIAKELNTKLISPRFKFMVEIEKQIDKELKTLKEANINSWYYYNVSSEKQKLPLVSWDMANTPIHA
jgi:transcriptional regulator with XRE-family HTH domain